MLCEDIVSKKKHCIHCGAALPEQASFCPYCTASQVTRRPMEPPRAGRKKRRAAYACGAAALVLAAGLLLALLPRPAPVKQLPQTDEQPSGLAGAYETDECQTWYEGEDGRLYHVFACFSPQPDGGASPASHRTELLPANEPGTSPLCLFVEDATDRSRDVREDFRALLRGHTIEAIPAEGSKACIIFEETTSYAEAGALLAHEHQEWSTCTYNDIVWTLDMNNGDTITLKQVIECAEKLRKVISWQDRPMDTAAELQALLDEMTAQLDRETELELELPAVSYAEPLTIRRPVILAGHSDGTEFRAPITVERMAFSQRTDIHVVLRQLRIVSDGTGDTGVTAMAPTYLDNCQVSGWEQGALAADGGWLYIDRTDFNYNGVAACFDTTDSSSWGGNLHRSNFVRNTTAIRVEQLPGVWMTLRVDNSSFHGNDTVLDGKAAGQVVLEETCFIQ